MEKATIKEAIIKSLSEEIDLWLDKQQNMTSGYEYETGFMKVAQKIHRILLEKSLDTPAGGSRNYKKNSPLLWENRHLKKSCSLSEYAKLWDQFPTSVASMPAGPGLCL